MLSTSTSTIWPYWVNAQYSYTVTSTGTSYVSSTDSTSTATSSDIVWRTWTSTGTGTLDCTSNGVWKIWTYQEETAPALSQEEIDARRREAERERAEAEERRRIEKEQKDAAEEVAKELLLDLIGPEEMEIYNETGRLFVKGRKFDYIIQKQGMLHRIEKDKITDLCVHLKDRDKFPKTDNVIALMMLLKADEDHILGKANNHGSRRRPSELPKFARAS